MKVALLFIFASWWWLKKQNAMQRNLWFVKSLPCIFTLYEGFNFRNFGHYPLCYTGIHIKTFYHLGCPRDGHWDQEDDAASNSTTWYIKNHHGHYIFSGLKRSPGSSCQVRLSVRTGRDQVERHRRSRPFVNWQSLVPWYIVGTRDSHKYVASSKERY